MAVRPTEGETLEILVKALDGLRTRVDGVYVHLDLDVLDPAAVAGANQFAPKGGLSGGALLAALDLVLGSASRYLRAA